MLTIRSVTRDERGSAKLGVAAAVVLALSVSATGAGAEPHLGVASPPGGPADQPAAAPPNPSYQPGFIDAFGRFIGESAAKLDSQLKSTNETLGQLGSQTTDAAKDVAKDAVGTAKEAAGALVGLPNARIVTGRERCTAAPNGAPDCRAAADTACRAKGFTAGKGLDTQSTQNCPARVWLSGRPPQDGDCQLETYLTRAVCQ